MNYRLLMLLLIFAITAANSDAKLMVWFSGPGKEDVIYSPYGFLVVLGLAALLFTIRLLQQLDSWRKGNPPSDPGFTGKTPGIAVALSFWFMAATFSFLFNVKTETLVRYYMGGALVPLLIFMALRGLQLTKKQISQIILVLSIGSLATLVLGLMAFYKMWGIPNLHILAHARYDISRMQLYRQMTFGNVGSTAQFLILIGGPALVLLFDNSQTKPLRIWSGFILILLGLNLIIIQSIAAFLVFGIALFLIIYFKKGLKTLLITISGCIIAGLFIPQLYVYPVRLLLIHRDSVFLRLQAMQEGWGVFMDHWLIGVGQGASYAYISANSAHQFFIEQGVELGCFGLFASVLLVVMVFYRMVRIFLGRKTDQYANERLILTIGPFMYLLYGVMANINLNIGVVNIWISLCCALLALADFKEVPDQIHCEPSLAEFNLDQESLKAKLES